MPSRIVDARRMPIPLPLPSLYWRAAVYNGAERRTGNSSTWPLGAGSPNAMGLVLKTSSWMLSASREASTACRISTLRSWTRSTGTVVANTISCAVPRVSRKNTRTRHSLPRGRRAAAGRTWSAVPLDPGEGPDRLRCPSVANLHAVGAHDLYLTQLQAQCANHACCVVAKGMR